VEVLARFKRWPRWAQLAAAGTVVVLGVVALGSASHGGTTRASTLPGGTPTTEHVATTTTERMVTTTTLVLAPGQIDALHPSSSLTPGDVFVDATVDVICVPGYSAGARDVSASTRTSVFESYGVGGADRSKYELDHLIPLELGGSNDEKNLWPQPLSASGSDAHDKDAAENAFHAAVCSGQVDLAAAQAGIMRWDSVTVASLAAPATTTTAPPATAPPTTAPPATLPPVTAPPVTDPPPTEPPVTSPPAPDCTPGYDPCIPPGPDVDCAGGSGNGPRYVDGPVSVTGSDPYGLDRDGNGIACES
jgi:hypothetical protein